MTPTYDVKAWREDAWWLVRVVGASEGADTTPLNALTQARTLTRVEQMARDLIATILDVDDDAFDIEIQYVLSAEVDELLCEAKGARAWLEAAQELWQERSAIAARALTSEGYSLRETAKLLDLSHQRVDQLVEGDVDPERSGVRAVQLKHHSNSGSYSIMQTIEPLHNLDLLVVIRNTTEMRRRWIPRDEEVRALNERLGELLADCAGRSCGGSSHVDEQSEERERRVDV